MDPLIGRVLHKGLIGLLSRSLLEILQLQLCDLGRSLIVNPLADAWPTPETANPGAYQMPSDSGSLEVKVKLGDIGIGHWQRAVLFQSNREKINPLVVWFRFRFQLQEYLRIVAIFDLLDGLLRPASYSSEVGQFQGTGPEGARYSERTKNLVLNDLEFQA